MSEVGKFGKQINSLTDTSDFSRIVGNVVVPAVLTYYGGPAAAAAYSAIRQEGTRYVDERVKAQAQPLVDQFNFSPIPGYFRRGFTGKDVDVAGKTLRNLQPSRATKKGSSKRASSKAIAEDKLARINKAKKSAKLAQGTDSNWEKFYE